MDGRKPGPEPLTPLPASVCRQQKLHVVEAVFCFTADQEKEHAEIFYNHMKELAGQTVAIDGTIPWT